MEVIVHLPPREERVDIRFVYDDEIPVDPLPGAPLVVSREVEAILHRHCNYDPTTNSRALVNALMALGWEPFPPSRRKKGGLGGAYVRMIYAGATRSVTACVNTRIIQFPASSAHLAASFDTTSLVDRYWAVSHVGSIDQALRAAAAVAEWADS